MTSDSYNNPLKTEPIFLPGDKYDNKHHTPINFTEYNIKETDMRVKTATFTSPEYIDLTRGLRFVKIMSKYHETFTGVVLDVEYDEVKGLYKYQCQDFSRYYMNPTFYYMPKSASNKLYIYNIIKAMLSFDDVRINDFFYVGNAKKTKKWKKIKKKWDGVWSGIRPLELYNQKLYKGNKYKGNPLKKTPDLYAYGNAIEIIRNLVFGQLGYFDIWFNEAGIFQLDPMSRTDWEKTGLHINESYADINLKFATTNAITDVSAFNKDTGETLNRTGMNDLQLTAFFGNVGTVLNYTTNATKNTNNKTSTTTNNANYKNNKIWIGADGGSGDFCQEIISELKKNGWSCHYSGTGANVHYNDLAYDVSGDYAVIAIVDNGFCCTTIKEAYVEFCKKGTPYLKRNGVRVMFMFDTRSWTSPDGMKPFRYGNFNYHVFHTAWDDSSGYCSSMNSTQFFKNWGATYCAHPTAKGIVDQFLAGGICK